MKWRKRLVITALITCLVGALFFMISSTLMIAESQNTEVELEAESTRSSPIDNTPYIREAVPEDYAPFGRTAIGEETTGNAQMMVKGGLEGGNDPTIFIVDVVVNNTDPALNTTDNITDWENSLGVNPGDPDEIVILGFSGEWGANAPLWHSTDGGLTWSKIDTIPAPPGQPGALGCPWDQTLDYGRNDELSMTFLADEVYSGTTTDPANAAQWNWFTPGGVTQATNFNALGNPDQPWLIVNRDPVTATQDNVYVGYDDFNGAPDMRVSVSYGVNPPNFTVDNLVGFSTGGVNPGFRLTKDPRTGYVYALFQRCVGNCGGDPKNIDFMLNRSTDGGANWTLNGSTTGIIVANADSTQPRPKFGTVNALLGGVDHAGVDPITGDLYYVYGNRNPVTGNDRLAMRRVVSDGSGGVIVGPESFVTGEVEAALPQVAVTDNGTLGVFYYTFDGFSSDDYPIFTAWLALSTDKGDNFTTYRLVTFLSPEQDSGASRQRVLGDYQQMKTVGNCFYGTFTANGAPFGRPFANTDPIFFMTCVGPQIQVPSGVDFVNICTDTTGFKTFEICNTGTDNLIIESITSSLPEFSVTEPSGGFPVIISPDFCFPFEIRFSPTDAISYVADLTIMSNDSENLSLVVELSGVGIVQDIETMMVANGSYLDVCLGSYKDLDLTIINSGDCGLTVFNIFSSSVEFVTAGVITYPIVIGPENSLAVPIRLEPTSLGAKNADISVVSDDPDTPTIIVSVSGNTPPGDIRVTGSTDFGDVCAGTLAEKTVSVCNVGACNLEVTGASIDCPDFEIINNPFPATVSPDSCVDLVVRFTPTSIGPKICTLTITSDDPDTPIWTQEVTANTPAPEIDVAGDQGFPATVIQSIDACSSAKPFPIQNNGICPLEITNIAITANESEFSLDGLPSFPIILQSGELAGDGALEVVFAPQALARTTTGELSVTYITDPIIGTTATITRELCGEAVHTGARVLVTQSGMPMDEVRLIQLLRINANRNRDRIKTVSVDRELALQTLLASGACEGFQYHMEYGTVSNPIQLLPGSYNVTVQVKIGKKILIKTVGFDVSTCDFNPTIIVEF